MLPWALRSLDQFSVVTPGELRPVSSEALMFALPFTACELSRFKRAASVLFTSCFLLLHFPSGINAVRRVNIMNCSFGRTLIRSLTVAPAAGVMDMQKLFSVFQWTHFVIALTHLWKTVLGAFTALLNAGAEWTVCLLTVYLWTLNSISSTSMTTSRPSPKNGL